MHNKGPASNDQNKLDLKKGAFLISAVHFKKSEIKNADWHSLWASLTFKK